MEGELLYRIRHRGRVRHAKEIDEERYRVCSGDPFSGLSETEEVVAKADATLEVPVLPSKIVGIGTNYPDGETRPDESVPNTFVMPPSALVASGRDVDLAPFFRSVLAEGELGVVIGKRARDVRAEEVEDHILGYTIVNDLSGRDSTLPVVSNFAKKSSDGFLPLGPALLLDSRLRSFSIETFVNGELVLRGNTGEMIHTIPECLAFITRFATLEPGDVVSTGTPLPKHKLHPGDEVRIAIDGIGVLANRIRFGADPGGQG
ncbi:MAG: fumarylacetoacetate hydrolase family protein [Myxococcota bacterium]|nr:fumarylacetoacetate hydrolase family protein [Myxococcota bacterium]